MIKLWRTLSEDCASAQQKIIDQMNLWDNEVQSVKKILPDLPISSLSNKDEKESLWRIQGCFRRFLKEISILGSFSKHPTQ